MWRDSWRTICKKGVAVEWLSTDYILFHTVSTRNLHNNFKNKLLKAKYEVLQTIEADVNLKSILIYPPVRTTLYNWWYWIFFHTCNCSSNGLPPTTDSLTDAKVCVFLSFSKHPDFMTLITYYKSTGNSTSNKGTQFPLKSFYLQKRRICIKKRTGTQPSAWQPDSPHTTQTTRAPQGKKPNVNKLRQLWPSSP